MTMMVFFWTAATARMLDERNGKFRGGLVSLDVDVMVGSGSGIRKVVRVW